MAKCEPLKFTYDALHDVIEIEGQKYTGQLFRDFGMLLEPGQLFRFIKRDGNVTLEKIFKEQEGDKSIKAIIKEVLTEMIKNNEIRFK